MERIVNRLEKDRIARDKVRMDRQPIFSYLFIKTLHQKK